MRLNRAQVENAPTTRLRELCRERGLEETGSDGELRERLVAYLETHPEPEPPPALPKGRRDRGRASRRPGGAPPPTGSEGTPTSGPPRPPAAASPRMIWTLLGVAVAIIVVTAVMLIFIFLPPPSQPLSPEHQYFRSMASIMAGTSTSLSNYTTALLSWEPLQNDNETVALMEAEQAVIQALQARLQNVTLPCDAYQGAHTNVTMSLEGFLQGMALQIVGVRDLDADAFDAGQIFFLEASDHLSQALGLFDQLEPDVPVCPSNP